MKIQFLLLCALFAKQLPASFDFQTFQTKVLSKQEKLLEKQIESLHPLFQTLLRGAFVFEVNAYMKKNNCDGNEAVTIILQQFKDRKQESKNVNNTISIQQKMQLKKKQRRLISSKINKNRFHIR